MAVDWNDLLLAYLHDPPDKALAVSARDGVPGHESRRLELAKAILGDDEISQSKIKKATAEVDVMAAQIERLAMPKGQHVNVADEVTVIHPLSGIAESLAGCGWNSYMFAQEKATLMSLSDGLTGCPRFLSVWRLWSDQLATSQDFFSRLPAETRNPDHTIWNHLDVTAAFNAGKSEGGGAALLAFALGPVQRFIEAARSVRDLWTGSMMLSWLAFRAMRPVVEQLGPTALVYPALRGNPLLDLWLRDDQRLGSKMPPLDVPQLLTPSLPHRFLAIVPWGADGKAAHALADKCRDAVTCAWQEMACEVKRRIQARLDAIGLGWDKRWDSQISEYFRASTAVVSLEDPGDEIDRRLARLLANQESFGAAFENAETVRELARSIPEGDRPNYAQDHAGRWQYQVELVGRSLASQRSIRHVPAPAINGNTERRFPQKCTLLGSFEQMGPDDLRQSKQFWDQVASQGGLKFDGVHVRKGEALCAVAMVKRFAGPVHLRKQLELSQQDLRFPDTWTVAAGKWLSDANIDWKADSGQPVPWNGHWLHWKDQHQEPGDADRCPDQAWDEIRKAKQPDNCGPPPVYYAILKLDGDDLGGWLRGEQSPTVRKAMHPTLVEYYEHQCGDVQNGKRLDAKRPVGPALHAAISTALSNFAMHVVPAVVTKHFGTVIYSGGDDTLILLPVSTAMACAIELRQAYRSDWHNVHGRKYLMMGSRATLSGGLVAVHSKDDLRLALADARAAEEKAKDAGKDALCITSRRRSGQHTSAICPWEFAETVGAWVKAFSPDDGNSGASDRWAYHLAAEQATLAALQPSAMAAEIRRQVNRAETDTRRRLGEPEKPKAGEGAGELLSAQFGQYCDLVVNDRRGMEVAGGLNVFLTLCQSASFMARGRDE